MDRVIYKDVEKSPSVAFLTRTFLRFAVPAVLESRGSPTLSMNLRPEAVPTFPLPPGEGDPKGRVRERPPGSGAQFVAAARPGGLSRRNCQHDKFAGSEFGTRSGPEGVRHRTCRNTISPGAVAGMRQGEMAVHPYTAQQHVEKGGFQHAAKNRIQRQLATASSAAGLSGRAIRPVVVSLTL